MNSRITRRLKYKAKNEKVATVKNSTLADKIFIDINNEIYNHKNVDRLQNAIRNSRIRNSYAGGCASNISTRKYACKVQRLRKARKSA